MIGNWFRLDKQQIKLHRWSREMIPRVKTVKYKGDFIVHIRFSDGMEGDVDLRHELYGEIFEPLKDQSLFAQVDVHPEFRRLNFCLMPHRQRRDN